MAAAGVAVIAAGLISQRGGSGAAGGSVPDLGFPPPPKMIPTGAILWERWNR